VLNAYIYYQRSVVLIMGGNVMQSNAMMIARWTNKRSSKAWKIIFWKKSVQCEILLAIWKLLFCFSI